ncbi:hypothetical protein LU196_18045 [Pantoea sp. Mb-10]|uniref:hypothetical protein n=1 Tax=unclassified Pantoea TaxID=2630326 RepID=UPI001E29287D|nr:MULTISPECIES: hypothetical protein [unclassified Pantoea]MCE0491938.1 hypothetical protein [Pantoea sp. Mb-10]MCE0503325.1 hypothetical protein [Pantoea sp. Pb-8]
MRSTYRIALFFLFITFGSMAKAHIPDTLPAGHRVGFNTHSGLADTAETPDEHIREEDHFHHWKAR